MTSFHFCIFSSSVLCCDCLSSSTSLELCSYLLLDHSGLEIRNKDFTHYQSSHSFDVIKDRQQVTLIFVTFFRICAFSS